MDDVISRRVAIDAVETIGYIATMPDGDKCIRRSAVKYTLSMLPSAQPTQEIIHCKDCRFWKKYKYFNGKPTYAPFCGFNSIFTDDNDFCSRAEKRGEQDG